MTEEEWLACADPTQMLKFLRGKASDRGLRLFLYACCRHIWHLLTDMRWRELVQTLEQYADGFASEADLIQAKFGSDAASEDASDAYVAGTKKALLHAQAEELDEVSVESMMAVVAGSVPIESAFAAVQAAWWGKQLEIQAARLRDIFGNPYRPTTINPNWLTPTVINLASAAYEERCLPSGVLDTARLAILADALEDESCDYADILGHLRSPGPHVRGCHVLDLLLGKE